MECFMYSVISRCSFVASFASLALLASASHAAILPGELLISEVLANPGAVSDTAGEWFELYNASANAIDLNGVKIRDEGSNAFTIAGSLIINAGDYLVFGRNGDAAVNGGYNADYVYSSFTMGNTNDAIIVESGGNIIASLIYNDAALYGANGRSAELIWNGSAFSYQLTSTGLKFGLGDSGTPGAAGSSSLPVAASAVPVPAAAWLFGSATLGLVGLRRKK
jgi:hypothetical protein